MAEKEKKVSCRFCGKEGYWLKTQKGNWRLMNPDGTLHALNCVNSPYFQKLRKKVRKFKKADYFERTLPNTVFWNKVKRG